MNYETSQFQLRRDFFAINSLGDSEFDWVLTSLGFTDAEIPSISAVIVRIGVQSVERDDA